MFLPGEVSITTSLYDKEVSRCHGAQGKRGAANCIGNIGGEGLKTILAEIRTGALIFA